MASERPIATDDGIPRAPRAHQNESISLLGWTLIGVAVVASAYCAAIAALMARGRQADARAVAGFVPDCAVLMSRLLRDPRVNGWRRALGVVAVGYLAMPFDLVPDFIPVAGQLDDALVVALVLRAVLRGAGPSALREHWPGPASSLQVVATLAYGPSGGERVRAPASP